MLSQNVQPHFQSMAIVSVSSTSGHAENKKWDFSVKLKKGGTVPLRCVLSLSMICGPNMHFGLLVQNPHLAESYNKITQ